MRSIGLRTSKAGMDALNRLQTDTAELDAIFRQGSQRRIMKKKITSTECDKPAARHAVFCDSPPRRPHYFAGQLLSADDLVAEQEYHRGKHRCHNLHCHGVGVIHGLSVSVANDKTDWTAIIQPGAAIDPTGNEVHLCAAATLPLSDSVSEIQVGIRAVERLGGSISAAGSEAKIIPAYVEEGCELALDPAVTRRRSLARCGEGTMAVLPLARLIRRGKAWRLDCKFKILRAR